MMTLNRRFSRNIRYNLSFYVSATLLTAIAAFLLVSMYSAVLMIDRGFNGVLERGRVEDAQFATMREISDSEAASMEKTFGVTLERVRTVDIEQDGYTLRVFAPTSKVNVLQLLEGSGLSGDGDILLNRDFAAAHGITPGDSFVISDRAYRVAGFSVRPDYVYAQKDNRDFYIDKAMFGQVTMTDAAFDRLEHTQSYWAVLYSRDNSVDMRKYLNDNYGLMRYLDAASNNRIDIVREYASEYGIMLGSVIPLLFAMITFIVAVVMGRMVRRERKQIGTLVALGYRGRELARHYAAYAAVPALLGSAIGVASAVVFLKPVCVLFATDYESVNYEPTLYAVSVALAFAVPLLLYPATAVLSVRRLLRKQTVQLLAGGADAARQVGRYALSKSRLHFGPKFRLRNLLAHKSRSLVVMTGMFAGTFLCAFGLIMIDSCNYLIERGLDAAGSYEYQYVLNTVKPGEPPVGEPELRFAFEAPGHDGLFTLAGLREHPEYLSLKTSDGAAMRYGGYYLTSNAAALYHIKAGEDFTFRNPFTVEEHTVRIDGIINDNTQCMLYTDIPNVAGLLGLPGEPCYNVVLSDRPLSMNDDEVAYTNSKEGLKKQFRYTVNLILYFVYLMLGFGAALCLISSYLTVNMLVEENRHNISMLKVLGYRKREINRLVLNVNHVLVPVSFALSVWACVELCRGIFGQFIGELNIYIEPAITASSILICAGALVLSYAASLALLKRKVYRVDMVESLKDNRE